LISPSRLKEVFTKPPSVLDSDYFFKTCVHLEGYVKRVMFIGLRLRGVQYSNGEKVVDSTYIQTANLIEKVLWLIDKSGSKQGDVVGKLKIKHHDFFIIKETVLKFSAPYRNRLAHGTIAKLHDQEMIDYLCHVTTSFIDAFELLLKSEHGQSAYDKPGDWGAIQGKPELLESTVKRLKLGSLVKEPLTLNAVKKQLQETKYAKP
jgi:hypothetical protein